MSAEAVPNNDLVAEADCRRAEPRRRVLLAGKIVLPDGVTFDCTIRNLTGGGAQVRVPPGQIVPNAFDLIDIRSGIAFRAAVVWRSPAGLGLKFSERFDLNQTAGAPLGLRVLWLGCASRGVSPSSGG